MTGGTNDTKSVKTTIGKNLQRARVKKRISRKKFAELLNNCENRPIINKKREEMTEDRLKTWEYGTNAINIEWIPLLCKTLDCDVGFLFGEYEEYTIDKQKIKEMTTLSTEAIDWILKNMEENQQRIEALNDLFEDDGVADELFDAIYSYSLSHYKHLVVYDSLNPIRKDKHGPDKGTKINDSMSKQMLKFSVQECFSDVLDLVWNRNRIVSEKIIDEKIKNLEQEIKSLEEDKNG